MHGVLFQKDTMEFLESGGFVLKSIPDIINVNSIQKITSFECYKDDKLFKYPYARIEPFLNSFIRLNFIKEIYKYKDFIVKINTDSVSISDNCDIPITFKMSSNLGDWKIDEKQTGNFEIMHVGNIKKI
jgi:hypothetical protein